MSAEAAAGEIFNNLIHVVSEFRDDGDLGARGNGAHEGEVAVITSHHLDDKAAVVGRGGGFDHIDQVNDGVQAGVDPNRHLSSRKVVIDRAG